MSTPAADRVTVGRLPRSSTTRTAAASPPARAAAATAAAGIAGTETDGGAGAGTAVTSEVREGARTGAALAVLGLGLVAAGLGAGHLTHHPVVGVALVGLAAAALAWGVLALRGPVGGTRGAVTVLLVAGPAVLLSAVPAATTPGLAEAAGAVLAVGAAITLALGLRLGAAPRRPRAWGQLGSLALASLLVAVVTVPGLAATDAGAHAVPHGSHGAPNLPAEESHHGH
ncbi:MAG TPA: hypothetical protein VGC57_11130 [Cellulomonas sp.]